MTIARLSALTEPSRRRFLTGAAGLVIGVALPLKTRAQSGAEAVLGAGAPGENAFVPNAFVRIASDDTVTVLIKHIEFGQGPWTGLATLVADELDADWAQIRAEHAPSDTAIYANILLGAQGTGGSTAMASSFDVMRKAGAAAREMLLSAAANAWGVQPAQLKIEKGIIQDTSSGRSGSFGEFADAASALPTPENPTLKTPDQFIFIGKNVPKLDTPGKSTGQAVFTLDVYKDGMQTVVVQHPDRFGATVASVDDVAARAVDGVTDVKSVSTGVAVYAQNTFAALKARKALSVEWDSTAAETRSSEQIKQACVDAAASRGEIAFEAGAVDDAFSAADQIVEAEYTFPFLVHAPMEPLDAVVARGEDGGVDLWMGSQLQTGDHQVAAAVCGLPSEKIRIHTMLAGGSFGRRAQPSSHLTAEAAEIFMAAGGQTPVKLVWTREDDIRGGYYRPIIAHKLRGGLNAAGDIVAWEQTIAGQSFIKGSPLEPLMLSAGFDPTLVEGAIPIPYAVDNALTTFHLVDTAVPTLWWRSVGHTHTGYAVETFVDELLALGGKDAVEGRLALLDSHERLAATVRRAADMADWGRSLPEGHALGVATVESFRSYVTQIADVSLENGMPRVHKVWCAVDCGIAVNPEIVRAQMEGGIGYGLGAVLFNDLTLEPGGAVKQSNFHDYASLRIGDMPDIDVSIIASDAPPTGVGEPGTPPIGPAVANAVRRLTGTPVRHLPMNTALQS